MAAGTEFFDDLFHFLERIIEELGIAEQGGQSGTGLGRVGPPPASLSHKG
ncbi:hypothetical protein ACTXJ3_00535 [Brachybacterium paraconglomeratum]